MSISYRKILYLLTLFLFIELVSFNVFLAGNSSFLVFIVLNLIVFVVSVYSLEYGFLIAVSELIISSKGYLFYGDFFGHIISIRMSIWFILVFLGFIFSLKKIYEGYKKNNLYLSYRKLIKNIGDDKVCLSLLVLFLFVLVGVLQGVLNNSPVDVFKDFNAYLYFLYFIPVYFIYLNKELGDLKKNNLITVIFSAIIWLSLKTLFLLYYFSHNFLETMPIIYKWVRDTGVGEITKMKYDFYRIFFQSHIFVSIFFLILLTIFLSSKMDFAKNKKRAVLFPSFLSVLSSVIIVSYSRTNWLGLFVVFVFLFTLLFVYGGFRNGIFSLLKSLLIFLLSVLILYLIVVIPIPNKGSHFEPGLLLDRASSIKGEAGVSSRWSLLPAMIDQIKKNPILGNGFGTEVTYKSFDPRVLSATGDGVYKTFSFEWGWLELWIKIGFLGMLSYLSLLAFLSYDFFKDFTKNKDYIYLSLSLSVILISVIHFFSPYLNHPLGIGYIILLLLIRKTIRKKA